MGEKDEIKYYGIKEYIEIKTAKNGVNLKVFNLASSRDLRSGCFLNFDIVYTSTIGMTLFSEILASFFFLYFLDVGMVEIFVRISYFISYLFETVV